MSATTTAEPIKGWACTDCIIRLVNGDSPTGMDEEQYAAWQLGYDSTMEDYHVTPGMVAEEHADGCPGQDGDFDEGCDCTRDEYSTSACDVCGSHLHGAREAVTFWAKTPHKAREIRPEDIAAELTAELRAAIAASSMLLGTH